MFRPAYFIAALVFLAIGFVLTGCSSSPDSKASSPEPTSLSGSYSMQHKDFGMDAVVTDTTITITMDSGGFTGLYWAGTFASAENKSIVVSQANREALSKSALASGAETKTFTVGHNTISFQFTMLGVTKTVELGRI